MRFGQLTSSTPNCTAQRPTAKMIVRRSAMSAAPSTVATSGLRLTYTATCVGVSRVKANVHRKKPSAPQRPLQRYAMVLDLGLIGCLVQYRGCCGSLLILTEPRASVIAVGPQRGNHGARR